jgi:bis(5'-nucleosyl)-tetraphosphatase (symmetrical)
MSTYIVGDLQGCLSPLKELLSRVNFDPSKDKLVAVGDLVNRGPDSLETLRFCKNLGKSFATVLGNHDLHLLAMAQGIVTPKRNDTLEPILEANDCDDLINWLRQWPLILDLGGAVVVHAGIPPCWSIDEAFERANEVEKILRSNNHEDFLHHMYGNSPSNWKKNLSGHNRHRLITNYLTRMRVCSPDGELELGYKGEPWNAPEGYYPWFQLRPELQNDNKKIIFGHWAALDTRTGSDNYIGLDSGCVWGNSMTLFELEKNTTYNCDCLID